MLGEKSWEINKIQTHSWYIKQYILYLRLIYCTLYCSYIPYKWLKRCLQYHRHGKKNRTSKFLTQVSLRNISSVSIEVWLLGNSSFYLVLAILCPDTYIMYNNIIITIQIINTIVFIFLPYPYYYFQFFNWFAAIRSLHSNYCIYSSSLMMAKIMFSVLMGGEGREGIKEYSFFWILGLIEYSSFFSQKFIAVSYSVSPCCNTHNNLINFVSFHDDRC